MALLKLDIYFNQINRAFFKFQRTPKPKFAV